MAKLRDRDKAEQSLGGAAGGPASAPPQALPAPSHAPQVGAAQPPPPVWEERFLGGGPGQEQRQFRAFARSIRRAQARGRGPGNAALRGLHAKMLAGTHAATLLVQNDHGGYFRAGRSYPVTLRFSSASGRPQSDRAGDLRGIALRVHTPEGGCDLLMTNAEVSHVRDAAEFMAFTSAMSRGRVLGVMTLLLTQRKRGFEMVKTALSQVQHGPRSLAAETFWSRAPFLLDGRPVRYLLRPEKPAALEADGDERLFADLKHKLAQGELRYGLWAQPYLDEVRTPLEDASKPWTSAPRQVATLVLAQQTLPDPSSATWREIDALRFDPWNTRSDMRPLGSMNRARRYVYRASQEERARPAPYAPSVLGEAALVVIERAFQLVNGAGVAWHRLGPRLGTLNLIGLRETFRRESLIGTDDPAAACPLPAPQPDAACARRSDGRFNDRVRPEMGAVGARFGRNVPFSALRVETDQELTAPDPRAVSEQLLKRTAFAPAPSLNLLAVAWIQFQVHDWFKHRERDKAAPARNARERMAHQLGVDPTLEAERGSPLDQTVVPAYENEVTHWWDCSQIYGYDAVTADALRDGEEGARKATLRLDAGLLPRDGQGNPLTGSRQNWWVGLEVMHTLFAREHNAICAALRVEHGAWSEQRIYEVARLINVATMAKIHTVEWTPALLAHPTLKRAMEAHWNGLFGRRWHKQEPPTTELRNGIPGSPSDHFEVPFALTEEFVSVYRLHPLLPDELVLRAPDAPRAGETITFDKLAFEAAPALARTQGIATLAYSLALACPGQMRLHNYPEFLRQLPPRDGRSRGNIDLAAVDVFRDRERSVPRYNAFREQFGLKRIESFAELEVDAATRHTLESLYQHVDNIDLLVGLLSETPPPGFAISDTAFRVFVGMASRRLKSDRFITDDFREELYTKTGLAWVQNATFKSVLQRNFPELHAALAGVRDVFAPWTP